jgi:hypothetical protein
VDFGAKQGEEGGSVCAEMHKVLIPRIIIY